MKWIKREDYEDIQDRAPCPTCGRGRGWPCQGSAEAHRKQPHAARVHAASTVQ